MNNYRKQQFSWIVIAILVIGIVFYAGFSVGFRFRPAIDRVNDLSNKEVGKPEKVDFAPFWKAWNVLNEKYVSATTSIVKDEDRVWGSIEGLASSLKDPYTVFFPPENAKLFESEIQGSFEGIGMEIGIKDSILTVIAPLKGTPAAMAGILPGDKILKIDDTVTSGMRVDTAIKMIRGKKGTVVRLTILHESKKNTLEIKVTRDTIAIPTIDTELKTAAMGGKDGSYVAPLQKNGVFIIRLYSFSANSPDLFRNALRGFIESGSDKLILDLRGNPGGYLEAAVSMASWFLPAGKVIVSEDFGNKSPALIYRSRGDNIFGNKLKFAILVNGGSASASEILAGALNEYGIAKLIGTKTFGKGSVQELVSITPETSLKVTVARWLTPNGISISETGIKPDIDIPISSEDLAKGKDPQLEAAIKLLEK